MHRSARRLRAAVALLAVVSCAPRAPRPGTGAQAPRAPATAPLPLPEAEREEPLDVREQRFRFVTHVRALTSGESGEETVEWWELRDPRGGVVHHAAYPVELGDGGFAHTTEVRARMLTTQLGAGVLVEGFELPSAPGTGSWVQIFGLKEGQLVAFGPPLWPQGELIDVAVDPSRRAPAIPGRSVIVMNDVLRFRIWTGNVDITYSVLINWIMGRVEPGWRCVRATPRGSVERCSYPVTAHPVRPDGLTFVRLFPEPDEGFTPAHVVVRPESTIDYVEAEVPVVWDASEAGISLDVPESDRGWLRIRVDGREGWIHDEEDFEAVGLPQAG
jgi:hypothetical protein